MLKPDRRSLVLICVVLLCGVLPVGPPRCSQLLGQESGNPTDPVVERFFEVLLANPRPGTAFDRVIEYHTQRGTLDEFLQSLAVDANHEQAGPRQLVLGLAQLQRGNFKQAADALAKADRWMPEDALPSFQLGKALRALGQNESAAEALQRAIERKPNRRDLSDISLEFADLLLDTDQSDRAVQLIDDLITQQSGNGPVMEKIAELLADAGKYERALQLYETLQAKARTADAGIGYQVAAADLREKLGQSADARKQLAAILSKLRPGSWLFQDVLDRLEASYTREGDYEGLIGFFSERADRDPSQVEWLIRLSEILSTTGQIGRAETYLQQAVERAPTNVEARLALVDLLEHSGKSAAAIEHLNRLIETDPANPDYLLRLGTLHLSDLTASQEERHTNAFQAWNRLAEQRRDDPVTLHLVATKLVSINRRDRAVEWLRAAIQAAPDTPKYRESLGELLHQSGQHDQALVAWQEIAGGTRRGAESLIRVADILKRFEELPMALQYWRDASDFDLTLDQRLRYSGVLLETAAFDEAIHQIELADALAETREERDRVLARAVETLTAAGRTEVYLASIALEKPSADNQRMMALLLRAAGRHREAQAAITRAIEFAPDRVELQVDAAEISEKAGDLDAAANRFESLAVKDTRYSGNHWRRVVQLRQQLRQTDAALQAARKLIDTNPGSPDVYQLFAELAFASKQDSEGENALRQVIRLSPRDVDTTLALGERLARRFETSQAIELYWQAVRNTDDLTRRVAIIESMVPLYERRGELEKLVTRIERHDPAAIDLNAKQVLISSVWSRVNDHTKAVDVLLHQLEKTPNNAPLLNAVIREYGATDQHAEAVEYLKRLLALQDTDENWERLLDSELKAGLATPLQADLRRIERARDIDTIGNIILNASVVDHDDTIVLARAALEKHPELWDIKIILAQLLLLTPGETREKHLVEADRLAQAISTVDSPPDTPTPAIKSGTPSAPSPLMSLPPSRVFQIRGGPPLQVPSRSLHFVPTAQSRGEEFPTAAARTLHVFQQLRDKISVRRGRNNQVSTKLVGSQIYVRPRDYYQADWIAKIVQIVSLIERSKLTGNDLSANDAIGMRFPPPDLKTADVKTLRNHLKFHGVIESLGGEPTKTSEALVWRVAELEPSGDLTELKMMLDDRTNHRRMISRTGLSRQQPLGESKLRILARCCQVRHDASVEEAKSIDQILDNHKLRFLFVDECQFAKKQHLLHASLPAGSKETPFSVTAAAIQKSLWNNDLEAAEEHLGKLIESARNTTRAHVPNESKFAWIYQPSSEVERAFIDGHWQTFIDAWIAYCSRRMVFDGHRLLPSDLIGNTTYHFVVTKLDAQSSKPKYHLYQLSLPWSKRLLSRDLVRGLIPLLPEQILSDKPLRSIQRPERLVEHLDASLDNATPHEQNLRYFVAAYLELWANRSFEGYLKLQTLADKHPDELDLQIETARLAGRNVRTAEAFARLDRLSANDESQTAQIELARLHLAVGVGMEEIARRSADRLKGMPLEPATRQLVAERLRDLAAKNQTIAAQNALNRNQPIQRRAAPPRMPSRPATTPTPKAAPQSQSDEVLLELATKLLDKGQAMTASEVAFSILNRVPGPRERDADTLRRRAIEILLQTDRLAPFIETTERKFKLDPNSTRLRRELAVAYVLAGTPNRGRKLWQEVVDANRWSARQIAMRASSLRSMREYEQAMMLYLMAIESDPTIWRTHWNLLLDSISMSQSDAFAFESLSQMDIKSFSMTSLCSMIATAPTKSMGPEKLKFVKKVLAEHPEAPANLDQLLAAIPEPHRSRVPELTALLQNTLASPSTFENRSPLWTLRGWSDKGVVHGILRDAMHALWSDEAAAEKFLSVTETLPRNNQAASFLRDLYQLGKPETSAAASTRLRARFPHQMVVTSTSSDIADAGVAALPASMLWQAGQLVGGMEQLKERATLQIGMFQAAIAQEETPEFIPATPADVSDQLFHAFAAAGRSDLAREGWLMRLHDSSTRGKEFDQLNRRLKLACHVSEQLLQLGFSVDATAVCREILAEPIVADRSDRFNKIAEQHRALEILHRESLAAITPEQATVYLEILALAAKTPNAADAILLHTIDFQNLSSTASDCLLEYAIRKAAETESGRAAAKTFLRGLEDSPIRSSHPILYRNACVITSAVVAPDRVADLLTTMSRDVDVNDDKKRLSEKLRYYYALAAVRRSEIGSTDAEVESLLTKLHTISNTLNDTAAFNATISLSRHTQSMMVLLQQISNNAPPGPLSRVDCSRCLDIAVVAAKKSEWELVAEAFQVALGSGPAPPEMQDAQSDAGSTPGLRFQSNDPSLNPIRDQLLLTMRHLKDDRGTPITSPQFDPDGIEWDPEVMKSLDRAVRKVVIPDDWYVNVYLYSQNVFQEGSEDPREDFFAESMSYAMGNLSTLCGTTDDLRRQIRRRFNAADEINLAAMHVDIAITGENVVAIDRSIDGLVTAVDDFLPKTDAESISGGDADSSRRIPRQPKAVVAMADQLTRTLWPVLMRNDVPPATKEKAATLLRRTVSLMRTVASVRRDYSEVIRTINAAIGSR